MKSTPVKIAEELELISSVLRGYPHSMAQSDALRAVHHISDLLSPAIGGSGIEPTVLEMIEARGGNSSESESLTLYRHRWKAIAQALRGYVSHNSDFGGWLWHQLMEWCKYQGISPSTYNNLFAIVDKARKQFPVVGKPVLIAPWPDYEGHPIRHGDRLVHRFDGNHFTAVHLVGYESQNDAWRAVYDDATVSRLCLQIDGKGQAVLADLTGKQNG